MRRFIHRWWWVVGLALGALILTAIMTPLHSSDGLVSARALDRIVDRLPVPDKIAKGIVAAAAFVVGLLLAALLRRLARRRPDPDADVPIAHGPLVAEPSAAVSFTPRFAETPSERFAAITAITAPTPGEVDDIGRPEDQVPPIHDAEANTGPAAAWGSVPLQPAQRENASSLARIEAALARLEARGPDRLDAIDARLGQMAQQLAELAALARAVARTPATAPLATPGNLRPPAGGDRGRSIGAAARALRASLDPAPESP